MAQKSLSQIRSLLEMQNPEIIGHELFPEPYLNELINFAQRDVQMNLSGLALQRFLTQTTGSISGGEFTSTYLYGKPCTKFNLATLTNRLERPKSVTDIETWYGFPDDSVVISRAEEVDREKFYDIMRNPYKLDYHKPSFMIDGEVDGEPPLRYLYLYPALTYPNTGMNSFLQVIRYYRICKELALDTDTLEIPIEYEHLVLKVANIYVLNSLGKIQNKDEAIAELMSNIKTTQDKFIESMNPMLTNEIAPIDEGAKLQ